MAGDWNWSVVRNSPRRTSDHGVAGHDGDEPTSFGPSGVSSRADERVSIAMLHECGELSAIAGQGEECQWE